MGIMSRITKHGLDYAMHADQFVTPSQQADLTMLDAYILAHALQTTAAIQAHRAAHLADVQETTDFLRALRNTGIAPANVIDPFRPF